MGNKFYAVLIDTASIQEYIFMSNKLKENVGASFLVERVFPGGPSLLLHGVIWQKTRDRIYRYRL